MLAPSLRELTKDRTRELSQCISYAYLLGEDARNGLTRRGLCINLTLKPGFGIRVRGVHSVRLD